jgi:S-adenosylmethionine:tRNA-ribosyltransferase-isomerase (queuine synthetase)
MIKQVIKTLAETKVYVHEDGLLERLINNKEVIKRLTDELKKQGSMPSKSYIKKEKTNEKQ